jgi:hypothetical protein
MFKVRREKRRRKTPDQAAARMPREEKRTAAKRQGKPRRRYPEIDPPVPYLPASEIEVE